MYLKYKIGVVIMKRLLIFIGITLIGMFIFISFNSGKTKDVNITIGASEKFSEKEIKDAIEAVKVKFSSFNGCTMTDLWYDEEVSNRNIEGYLENRKGSLSETKEENVIVLISNFNVDESGGDGSLNRNSTYPGWQWILLRNDKDSNWKVNDSGY